MRVCRPVFYRLVSRQGGFLRILIGQRPLNALALLLSVAVCSRALAQSRASDPVGPAFHWVTLVGQSLLAGCALWAFSYWRLRRITGEKKVLEQRLMDCAAELETEKSILTTLRKLPARDRVTMAWNRTAIMEILVREMLRAVRENSSLGIVIAELDDLKGIQAAQGMSGGEIVVQQTAERLLSVMRAYDAVGHYRDNDFLIVLPGWNPESAPQRIVSILDTIGLKPCVVADAPLRVTSSLGVAAFDPRMDSPYPEELLRRAEEALHMSRAAGPNHAVVAPR